MNCNLCGIELDLITGLSTFWQAVKGNPTLENMVNICDIDRPDYLRIYGEVFNFNVRELNDLATDLTITELEDLDSGLEVAAAIKLALHDKNSTISLLNIIVSNISESLGTADIIGDNLYYYPDIIGITFTPF